MKRHSKRKSKVNIDPPKDRSGHYDYQSKGKSQFNNRPKRQRTRQKEFEAELEDQIDGDQIWMEDLF